MRRLETLEFLNALTDLVTKRAEALGQVTYGVRFLAAANALIAGFAALPEAISRLPLSDLLALLDDEHDDWGAAIDHLIKAIEEGPDALAPLRPAAELVRSRYMSKRSEVLASYATQDQRGRDRLASLDADKGVLDRVTALDGRPLSAWLGDYANAGTKLGDGLAGRVDTLAAGSTSADAKSVQTLRGETRTFVTKLRQQIQADLENNPALPRTLEADVLGYFDELSRLADARAKSPKKPQ